MMDYFGKKNYIDETDSQRMIIKEWLPELCLKNSKWEIRINCFKIRYVIYIILSHKIWFTIIFEYISVIQISKFSNSFICAIASFKDAGCFKCKLFFKIPVQAAIQY